MSSGYTLRKAVDLYHFSLWKTYFNESSLHDESEYVITILIEESTDILIFGSGRVKGHFLHGIFMLVFSLQSLAGL